MGKVSVRVWLEVEGWGEEERSDEPWVCIWRLFGGDDWMCTQFTVELLCVDTAENDRSWM